MTLPAQDQFQSWRDWAQELVRALDYEQSVALVTKAQSVLLAHRKGDGSEKANTNGLFMFEPTKKEAQITIDGEFIGLLGASAVVLDTDVTNNNAIADTIADVIGLEFPVEPGTYWFRFFIWYTAAAVTTGSRWSINGPANSLIGYRSSTSLITAGTAGTDQSTATNAVAYDSPAAANTDSPTATAGQANTAVIEGLITVTAAGSVIARFASEVAGSAIVAKAGSLVLYKKVL